MADRREDIQHCLVCPDAPTELLRNVRPRSGSEIPTLDCWLAATSLKEEIAAIIQTHHRLPAADVFGRRLEADRLGQVLVKAGPEVREDQDIALGCVGIAGCHLEHFSDKLRADRGFVLSAVALDGSALQHVAEELQGDREVVLAAVSNKRNGGQLRYASEQLRGDRELAVIAARSDGSSIQYLSKELRADKEVVLAAVGSVGTALVFASEDLRADKEVVLSAIRSQAEAFMMASAKLKTDKDVALAAVSKMGTLLTGVSPELLADKEVVLAAVCNDGRAINLACAALKADRDVVLAAARNWGPAIGNVLDVASDDLRADRAVVLAAAKEPSSLGSASLELRNDKDFVLLFARQSEEPSTCFAEAGENVRAAMSIDLFLSACASPLAVPGQPEAPATLEVCLTTSFAKGGGVRLQAKATLLSGEELACDLPAESRPVLNDLAQKLLEEVQSRVETNDRPEHVRLYFLKRGCDDPVVVTAWDCDHPLSDFLYV